MGTAPAACAERGRRPAPFAPGRKFTQVAIATLGTAPPTIPGYMNWLAELFETNRIIVLSVSGQVFFVMGLAVALQSRKRSELPLARALGWLAGFGIVHGLMEWGYLFVPIQAGFLPQPLIEGLLVLQLILKPISFALLFQFGVELLMSTGGARPWLRLVPAGVLAMWAVATLTLSSTVAAGFVPESGP
ncbi:hypothetical protein BH23CHL9_BH23CHL9_08020 [soil metagenome]